MAESVIVWFRDDLRLGDNPALEAAVKSGLQVVPVFIWSPAEEHPWEPGGASRWWLHQSLGELIKSLREGGSRLIIRSGPTLDTLHEIASETRAKTIFWNRRYEPAVIERDKKVKISLQESGIEARSLAGNLLHEPWSLRNTAGQPFRVFTPFAKALRALAAPAPPVPAPAHIPGPSRWPSSLSVGDLGLEPKIDWAGGLRDSWTPGEAGAHAQLNRFLGEAQDAYETGRNLPGETGTSRISPHLHFGEITARQVWHFIETKAPGKQADAYLRQVIWRDFAYSLLFHFPETPREPLRKEFREFPSRFDRRTFRAWTKGLTGYPLLDAGMRELWHTGWMHNRVRMVTASFLVKHLMIPWQRGAEWFWDTLVDADLANNTFGWQWTAGCGADAAPYFRVFNPVLQGEKFDPDGKYVRQWIPEIGALPDQYVHRPWMAPKQVLADCGIELGLSYPLPIVDHEFARKRALSAYSEALRS